jgi:hypothetical protein
MTSSDEPYSVAARRLAAAEPVPVEPRPVEPDLADPDPDPVEPGTAVMIVNQAQPAQLIT